ncbi:MAG: hypothetical protein DMF84_25130 [Acidobacteria bacterium]|nr:MAG: hypothetical protein DMF84_25130 [Acidobacteriota bacterium]
MARFAHGSVSPARVVFTPAGQIVLLDPIYGAVLERLAFTRQRLWNEFGVAVAPSAGPARFDVAADLTQAGITAAALIVGRPLGPADYPNGIQALRAEILEVAQIRGTTVFANGFEKFFDRVLPLAGRKAFPSADDAVLDLRQLVRREIGIDACRAALLEFLQQVESAEAERTAAEEVLAAQHASDRHEHARVDGEREERARHETERRERERRDAEARERARLEAERHEKEKHEAERRERERLEAERRERERQAKLEAERKEKELREKEKLEAERRERERLEAEKRERERVEAERRERARLEAERLEKERIERERVERERLEAEQRERERLEAERLEKERLERERIERGRLEAEMRERARLEAERRDKERLERERIERERLEAEQRERARLEGERREKERQEAERREAERRERERREKERLEAERLERERQAKLEAQRKEKERLEADRREKERVEKERQERERQARLEAERKEKERLEADRRERERQAKLEAERKEKERLETDRRDKERREKERLERERLERERAEAERREKERAAAERREQELAAQADAEEGAESAGQANKRRKRDKSARSKKDRLRSAAPGSSGTTPTPAHTPAGAGSKSSWLVPPDRAAAFEPPVPVLPQAPVHVAAPQTYPVYMPPATQPPIAAAMPPPVVVPPVIPPSVTMPTQIGFAPPKPVAQPQSAPIGLAQPTPIRLKHDTTSHANPASFAPRRDRDVAFTPDFSANPTDTSRGGIPWKIAGAAGVVLLIGVAAAHSLLPSGKVEPTRSKPTPSTASAAISTPAPSSTAGQIVVATQPPGARVLLDGKAVGESPVTLQTVTPGRHTVTLITESGSVKKTVRVEAGRSLSLDIPIFSGFAAISAPIVVEVAEGGRLLGTSENQIMLPPGRHQLRFTNNALNYQGTQTVEIEPGEVYKVSLEPRGSANINAQPWAEVWIDGVRVGETPIANVSIALGVREIVFRNPQFGERKLVTTITGGPPAALSVDFTKQ